MLLWFTLFFCLTFLPLFVLIFLLGPSPSCKNTLLASSYVFLSTTLPSSVWNIVKRILGPKWTNRLLGIVNWIGYERNPLVQIFFLALLSAGVYIFWIFGWPRIPNELVPAYHRYIIAISIIQAYVSFFWASFADPGKISAENAKKCLSYYPMDYLLFSPTVCKTCHFIKPARSKHCSMCRACIMRLDHHCIWINNCVGQSNVHLFVFFLWSVLWICLYGFYICYTVASPNLRFDLIKEQGYFMVLSWAFLTEPALVSLGIFIGIAGLLVFIFLVYFFYLNVWHGMTTNETMKWEDIEWMMEKGHLYVQEKNNLLVLSKEPCDYPKTFHDLINIYDKGILMNLKEIIWPRRLPPITKSTPEDKLKQSPPSKDDFKESNLNSQEETGLKYRKKQTKGHKKK